MPPGYAIRDLRADDAEALIAIEARAGRRFGEHGYAGIADAPPRTAEEFAELVEGASVLVAIDARGRAAGFAVAANVAGAWWLREISVDPDHGRRGVGSALLAAFLEQARRRGHALAALSTFRDVPFNAPFYRRRGFVEIPVDAAPAALKAQTLAEIPDGVGPAKRLLMVRVP